MKKHILVASLLFLFTLSTSTANAECDLPVNLPAPPPEYEEVWDQTAHKLDSLNRDLIKLWECPTAYPYLLIGGEKGYILFYVIDQYGKNSHRTHPMVAGFVFRKGNWRLHRILYLNEKLDEFYPKLYLSLIMNNHYGWD